MPPKTIFDLLDVSPNDCPKHYVNRYEGDLLLVGGARCVWEDTRGLPEPSNTMCVNDVGMYWPGKVTHWYSNDIDQLIHWCHGRRRPYHIYGGHGELHSATKRVGDEYQHVHFWPFPTQGSSGLVALYVALAMGYNPITVAGMSWDDDGHFFDPPTAHNLNKDDRGWTHFSRETPQPFLEKIAPLCRGRVNVVSGRLKEILEG